MPELEDWTAGPSASWIVVDTDVFAFDCRRCFIHEPFDVPVDLFVWTRQAQEFVERHRTCRPRERIVVAQESLL